MDNYQLANLIISSAELLVIISTAIIAFLTFKRNEKNKKRQYVIELQKEFINNDDLYIAMHIIEFKTGWYTNGEFYFNGEESLEKKIDRLFIYLSNVINLYKKHDINTDEFNFFKYKINAVFDSKDACMYLSFINYFSKECRQAPSSFQVLIDYGIENKKLVL